MLLPATWKRANMAESCRADPPRARDPLSIDMSDLIAASDHRSACATRMPERNDKQLVPRDLVVHVILPTGQVKPTKIWVAS